MRYAQKALTFSPNATMSATLTSDVFDIRTEWGFSVQAVWTGTPTGALKIQISHDQTNWDDYPSSSQALAGAAGHYTWDITQTNAPYARLVYTFTSSTGALTANYFAKGT